MISLPNQPKIIKKDENKAIFQIEALYPGYGITVGNSLRRVLLSSLSGAAVTQMKIKGISHEFSTIPGIVEDVVALMLNVKQLRFKLYDNEPQKAILKVKGEKKVKGADFKIPTQVELVNKNCHIASLTAKSSELEMEIQIERGIGYSSREARKKIIAGAKEKLGIGMIPLDAIFTPVKRVSYYVENMRVRERTDFDRLFLEIETDGIITPEKAFSKASEILVNHFSLFTEAFNQLEKKAEIKISAKKIIRPKAKAFVSKTPSASSSKRIFVKKTKKHEKKKKGTKVK